MLTLPGEIVSGAIALTWPGEVKEMNAGRSLIRTRVPFRVVGAFEPSKRPVQSLVTSLRAEPRIEKKAPGAMGVFSEKVAPLRTPAVVKEGAVAPTELLKGLAARSRTSDSERAFV